MHQGGCLTGLGDTNRIRGHSGSYSLFIVFHSPLPAKATVSGDPGGVVSWMCEFIA